MTQFIFYKMIKISFCSDHLLCILTNLIHLLFHFEKILESGADNLDNTVRTEREEEYSLCQG